MNTDKLEFIVSECKASVSVTINDHKDNYESIEDYISRYLTKRECEEELPKEVLSKMIEMDRVVCVQFYPDTPIGFYVVFHHDIESALDKACHILEHGVEE